MSAIDSWSVGSAEIALCRIERGAEGELIDGFGVGLASGRVGDGGLGCVVTFVDMGEARFGTSGDETLRPATFGTPCGITFAGAGRGLFLATGGLGAVCLIVKGLTAGTAGLWLAGTAVGEALG